MADVILRASLLAPFLFLGAAAFAVILSLAWAVVHTDRV